MSAFDLCQTQGFRIENNSPQAIEISLLLGSVTLQSTEPKLSGERCSPFSTRLSTCEYKVFIHLHFHGNFISALCLGLTKGGKMPTCRFWSRIVGLWGRFENLNGTKRWFEITNNQNISTFDLQGIFLGEAYLPLCEVSPSSSPTLSSIRQRMRTWTSSSSSPYSPSSSPCSL